MGKVKAWAVAYKGKLNKIWIHRETGAFEIYASKKYAMENKGSMDKILRIEIIESGTNKKH